MNLAAQLAAWAIALAWLWKAATATRGLPSIPNLNLARYNQPPEAAPRLAVIVPARNEAAAIEAALRSLLNQDYNNLQIIAVDDRSTDATGAIIDALAKQSPQRLHAMHITELPTDWLGKTHAMAAAAQFAIETYNPDYLLFTDGDVLFQSNALRISLAQAVATQADHFVTFPTPILQSLGEGILLGYLGIMGMWATRPWKAEDPKARDAIGIGAFNLLRVEAYRSLGGFESLRMEILEDLTLAQRVKRAGLRQRVARAPGMISLHWAKGASGVMLGMTKNLFAVFRFRVGLMLLACVWFASFCLGPIALLALPQCRVPAMFACAAITWLYWLSCGHSKISPWYALGFPIAALLFLYSILRSAAVTIWQGGVVWRGTFYQLRDLREFGRNKEL